MPEKYIVVAKTACGKVYYFSTKYPNFHGDWVLATNNATIFGSPQTELQIKQYAKPVPEEVVSVGQYKINFELIGNLNL